jgi:hypothetical protein
MARQSRSSKGVCCQAGFLALAMLCATPALADGPAGSELLIIGALREGQALDSGRLSVSELRPGAVDQVQLRTYLAMAPETDGAADADESLAMLAALSLTDDEAALLQTASAYVGQPGLMPRSQMGMDGVWEFPRRPDSDEMDMLVGQHWRIVLNDESQVLFLGPDRTFGFDDFLDIINPLQHIPLISVGYRALTGDEIYGAARLIELGMGPAAGAGTVFDLALESTTGATMEDHAMAALFGNGNADNLASIYTDEQQVADRGILRRGSNQ